jgi:hypothetical protein
VLVILIGLLPGNLKLGEKRKRVRSKREKSRSCERYLFASAFSIAFLSKSFTLAIILRVNQSAWSLGLLMSLTMYKEILLDQPCVVCLQLLPQYILTPDRF